MCGLSALFCDGERVDECPDIHQWGEKRGLFVNREDGRFGDIVLFDWYETGTPCHVGSILGKEQEYGRYITLEGNTSDGNDSCGGGVMIRQRRVDGVYSIIRPGYDTPAYQCFAPSAEGSNRAKRLLSSISAKTPEKENNSNKVGWKI